MKPSTLLTSFVALSLLVGPVLQNVDAADMKDKVCPRVVNRFSDNDVMWDRVNGRIQSRFGFMCERSGMTKAKQTPIVVEPVQGSSSAGYCDNGGWICGAWTKCSPSGKQERVCSHSWYCGEAITTPPTKQSCTYQNEFKATLQAMLVNIEKWRVLQKDMVVLAKELQKQGKVAKDGMSQIVKLEERYLAIFNDYVRIYNIMIKFTEANISDWEETGSAGGVRKRSLVELEGMMGAVEREFKAIPTFWY